MSHYRAHVEVDLRKLPDEFVKHPDTLIEQFAPYDGAVGMSPAGLFSVQLTVPGDTMPQAAVTAVAVVESIVGATVIALELMTDAEFSRREGWDDDPDELLTTTQAARMLGTSRQAVGQRLNAGTLRGERRGRDWLITRREVEAALDSTRAAVAAARERIEDGLSVKR